MIDDVGWIKVMVMIVGFDVVRFLVFRLVLGGDVVVEVGWIRFDRSLGEGFFEYIIGFGSYGCEMIGCIVFEEVGFMMRIIILYFK